MVQHCTQETVRIIYVLLIKENYTVFRNNFVSYIDYFTIFLNTCIMHILRNEAY